jgi:hypothetical protein
VAHVGAGREVPSSRCPETLSKQATKDQVRHHIPLSRTDGSHGKHGAAVYLCFTATGK